MAFPLLGAAPPAQYATLNVNQEKAFADLYANGGRAIDAKHNKTIADFGDGRYVSAALAQDRYKKGLAIYNHVVALMSGETPPTTLTALKSTAYTSFADENQVSFDYLVDKIIEKSTAAGTFTTFKAYFDSLTEEA